MLQFDLPLTKADQGDSLVYTLITTLDVLLSSGQLITERGWGGFVTTLQPMPSANGMVGKIRSTLIKLAHADVDSDELISIMKEHEYEFGLRRHVDQYQSEVIISTPSGILSFRLLA